jgi:hypothetical protein
VTLKEAPARKPISHDDFRGFYVDFDYDEKGTRSDYPMFEDLSIDFYQSNKIAGTSRGESRGRGQTTKKEWQLTGFVISDFFFMSYVTAKDDDKKTSFPGAGVYALGRNGANYTGYVLFRDATHNVTARCPYILTRELRMTVDKAKDRWDQLLEKCENVVFKPAF